MKTHLPRIASALTALALLAAAGAAGAADLNVFSTTALTEIWQELKPKFEARGHKLELALQSVTGFAAAALSSSANPAAAKALVEFLASAETLALLKSRGFDVKP